VTSWQGLDDPDFDSFLEFPVNGDDYLSWQLSCGQDNTLVADVSFQAAKLKPMSRIAQMMAEQILGQGLGDPIKNDFGARDAMHQYRFDPTQMKGSVLATLKPTGMAFMQADPVDGTGGDDRFVRDDLNFNQKMVASPIADDLAPEQAPFKPFEQADLFDHCGRGQVVIENGRELIAGEDGGKIENVLHRQAVLFAIGHNLQAHLLPEEDHDLMAVPLGELKSEGGFDFLDDFGCGEGVPAG
jgi:hypothetical protein